MRLFICVGSLCGKKKIVSDEFRDVLRAEAKDRAPAADPHYGNQWTPSRAMIADPGLAHLHDFRDVI